MVHFWATSTPQIKIICIHLKSYNFLDVQNYIVGLLKSQGSSKHIGIEHSMKFFIILLSIPYIFKDKDFNTQYLILKDEYYRGKV